jgi:hypothetical protein
MTNETRETSIGTLLRLVSADLRTLASQTLALGRLELSLAATSLAWSALGLCASIFAAIAGVCVLVSALVLIAIALGLPAWASGTLVGILLTAGGALSARHFLGKLRGVEFTLKETRESVRETLEWLSAQTSR